MANEELYRIIIAPAANDRMADHFEFLSRVSEDAAARLLDKLAEDIGTLQKNPFRNPVYDRPYVLPLKYRYMISNKRYRIVYQIVGDIVFVDDIQDCRESDEEDVLNP